jgi:hypothetical protein
LNTKRCRIEFQESFRNNIGAPDLSEKSYSRKNAYLKKYKKKILVFR